MDDPYLWELSFISVPSAPSHEQGFIQVLEGGV